MKKTKLSRRQSVRASGKHNSLAVPSGVTVKQKSKKSSGSKGLKVATPQDTALQYLRDEGLIAPEEVSPEIDSVPLDFTHLNGRQIGAVHSRYAVRHSHAIFTVAKAASRLAVLRRDLRIEQAKFRFKNKMKFKTKYELDDAMQLEGGISELVSEITVLEARVEVMKAVAEGYEDLRNAASREMFRRSTEQATRD